MVNVGADIQSIQMFKFKPASYWRKGVMEAVGTVKATDGVIVGMFVGSAYNSPFLAIYDGPSVPATGTLVVGTFAPQAGTYYNLGEAYCSTSIGVAKAGSVDVTLFYK